MAVSARQAVGAQSAPVDSCPRRGTLHPTWNQSVCAAKHEHPLRDDKQARPLGARRVEPASSTQPEPNASEDRLWCLTPPTTVNRKGGCTPPPYNSASSLEVTSTCNNTSTARRVLKINRAQLHRLWPRAPRRHHRGNVQAPHPRTGGFGGIRESTSEPLTAPTRFVPSWNGRESRIQHTWHSHPGTSNRSTRALSGIGE